MWIAEGRPLPTPEHFDQHYLDAEGAHKVLAPPVQERLEEVVWIATPLAGRKVLDLGGGALLARMTGQCLLYQLVDMSKEGCRIAKEVAPWIAPPICGDVLDYLGRNVLARENERPRVFAQEYDVTVAIGLVEYLPPDGMDRLFRDCPSPALAFTTAVKEGYLQYQARVVCPDRDDVARSAERWGWKIVREMKKPDHVWARYERS